MSGKSMMTTAWYKSGELMITSLIIIKMSFIGFLKDEFDGSHIESHTRSFV